MKQQKFYRAWWCNKVRSVLKSIYLLGDHLQKIEANVHQADALVDDGTENIVMVI
jgi:hypothetical protein